MKTYKEDAVKKVQELDLDAGGISAYLPSSATFEEWCRVRQVTPETMLEIIRLVQERATDAIFLYVLTVFIEGKNGKFRELKTMKEIKPGSNRKIRFCHFPLRPYSPQVMEVD